MQGMLDLEDIERLIEAETIDTVLVVFPDLQGRLMGKRVTGDFFLEHAHEQVHACDYLLAADMDMEPVPGYKAASWAKGYGDLVIRPDMDTLRLIPWLTGTALVVGDTLDHQGRYLAHAPRTVLRRQIDRLTQRGWVAMMGSELEFYLFNEPYEDCNNKRYRNLRTAGWYIEDYHILQTTKEESIIRAIRRGMDGAGIPVEFSKGEWGPGQEEINLRYAEALEMADRHTIYKNGVKEIAHIYDKAVTFMAKWHNDLAGSSCHIHTSLWSDDEETPLFYDPNEPLGMSELFRHFLAGQLALARDMTYFLAPYINSYKRYQEGSFAPTKAVWSVDNRTAGFRILGHGSSLRFENRIPGADVNPYLAYAAVIAAGLYGVDNQLELEPALRGDAYTAGQVREVPKTLREALEALDRSTVLREAMGDDVVDHYLHTGRWEQREYDRRVTDWELVRGFERA